MRAFFYCPNQCKITEMDISSRLVFREKRMAPTDLCMSVSDRVVVIYFDCKYFQILEPNRSDGVIYQ